MIHISLVNLGSFDSEIFVSTVVKSLLVIHCFDSDKEVFCVTFLNA